MFIFVMKDIEFKCFILQQELGEAAANAQIRFHEKFPDPAAWTSKKATDFVFAAVKNVRTQCFSELKKQLHVADPDYDKDFLHQIKIHYEKNEEPEMTQEKLWMLATSAMESHIKIKWLERWNSTCRNLNFSNLVFLVN